MINNKLILRTVNSPFTISVPDFTKGSVLTHIDLDNNFIYLKGEVIHDVTISDGTTTLHKINGNNITYNNNNGQNNLIKSFDHVLNLSGGTISELINLEPNGLIIDDKTSLFLKAKNGDDDIIYGFASGKGNWGTSLFGGTPVTEDDFTLIYSATTTSANDSISKTIFVNSDDLEACITCSGTIEEQIAEYINTLNYNKEITFSDVWVEYTELEIDSMFTVEFTEEFG